MGFVEDLGAVSVAVPAAPAGAALETALAASGGRLTFGPSVPGFCSDPQVTLQHTAWYRHFLHQRPRVLLAEYVLGKLNTHAMLDFLIVCRNALQPGGRLRIAEADLNHPLPGYQENIARHAPRQRFTLATLTEALASVGFASQAVEYRNAAGVLHEFDLRGADYGHVFRSSRHDTRAGDPALRFSSLIVDAIRVSEQDRGCDGFTEKIHAMGDSHVRFLAGKDEHSGFTSVRHLANLFQGHCARFVGWHLGPALAFSLGRRGTSVAAQEKIEALMADGLPADARLMFSFGEIDCRFHVCRQAEQQGRPDTQIIDGICEAYLAFLDDVAARGFRPMVWAPFAATWATESGDPEFPIYGSYERRHAAVARFNERMRAGCKHRGYDFVSLFAALHDAAGMPRQEYFCDGLHLGQRARALLHALMPDG